MANFYSVKKSSPYSIKATKKASAYKSNKKQNNVYSNSIGIFDKEYVVIQSSVPGSTSSTSVVIPVVPVANVAPSTVPAEPVGTESKQVPAEPTLVPVETKQSSSKKKTSIIIALAALAAAVFLFYPGKKK